DDPRANAAAAISIEDFFSMSNSFDFDPTARRALRAMATGSDRREIGAPLRRDKYDFDMPVSAIEMGRSLFGGAIGGSDSRIARRYLRCGARRCFSRSSPMERSTHVTGA